MILYGWSLDRLTFFGGIGSHAVAQKYSLGQFDFVLKSQPEGLSGETGNCFCPVELAENTTLSVLAGGVEFIKVEQRVIVMIVEASALGDSTYLTGAVAHPLKLDNQVDRRGNLGSRHVDGQRDITH
jgi:hypothetical protein